MSSLRRIRALFNKFQQFILTKIDNSIIKAPTVSLAYQNLIKQLKNLTKFLLRLGIWLRVLLLFAGLALMVCVYPNTRIAALFFIVQAIFLPLIWMLVNLADAVSSFVIDYYLNRWAKEGHWCRSSIIGELSAKTQSIRCQNCQLERLKGYVFRTFISLQGLPLY